MLVIGLMSGTSADAIDVALCEFQGAPPAIHLRMVHAVAFAYPDGFQARILDACLPEKSRVDTICQINFDMGELFAQAALYCIREASLKPEEVALIGSHGQTLWHQVGDDGRASATLQITEASILAERTGITTISNFRPRDIAAGGQGAPLTAYADWLLLRHPTKWRAIQNIGGIGNVTFLPPLSDTSSRPLSFDTGPGNALIDSATVILTEGRQAYDRDSTMAQAGHIDEDWLQTLALHPYYERRPPKTTGRELFGVPMATQLIKDGRARGLDGNSIIATLTALTAATIADAYRHYAPAPIEEVILGGGGGRNPFLVIMLEGLLPGTSVLKHEDVGLDSDNKEALVFALLAYETWHARPGNLPSLTGASKPVVLGQITPGNNYVDLLRKTWGNS
ncbi:MAG: anhydro-N-acetylmuramic acid kinase [Anaerolineae bacterium]|nr:anhydro-N-acetylmuramic acid kinase [Anaerolineae bacterium]